VDRKLLATEGHSQSPIDSNQRKISGAPTSQAGIRDKVGETHCEREVWWYLKKKKRKKKRGEDERRG
jgi:hypothetical protein